MNIVYGTALGVAVFAVGVWVAYVWLREWIVDPVRAVFVWLRERRAERADADLARLQAEEQGRK